MLKRLAMLAVLATASVGFLEGQSTPLSSPKERVAKTDSGQNTKQQPETDQHKNAPINLTSADVEMVCTPCDEACQQGRRNLEIQGKLEWFTGLQAIVGVLHVGTMIWQAILLRQTRGDVHAQAEWMRTQAGYMERQTKIMEDSITAVKASANASLVSAAAAEQSAKAAIHQIELVKNKERAQLSIEFSSLGIETSNLGQRILVPYKIRVYGTTRATILHSSIAAWVPSGDEELIVSGIIDLPITVSPSEESLYGQEVVRENAFQRPQVSQEIISMVIENTRLVVIQGNIRYQDVFRDVWVLPFSLRWKNRGFLSPTRPQGYWESYKDPYGEENCEYPEKTGRYMERAIPSVAPPKPN